MVRPAAKLRGALRITLTAAHLVRVLAVVAMTFAWRSQVAQQRLKSKWSRQLLATLGVRLRSQGRPQPRGMIVANHISWLDILAINALAPSALVSKDDVRNWPVIGWLAEKMGTLFIERGSRLAAQRTREHLVEELRAGSLVGVFPEGTTGYGDHVMPFHGALFQSALDAGAPIAPVLLQYRDAAGPRARAAAYVGETSFFESFKNIIAASGLTVEVSFLPVIATTGSDRRHLAHHCHQIIAHALASAQAATDGGVSPSPPVQPDVRTAAGILVDPQGERQSGYRPTGSLSPEQSDSSRA